MNGFSVLSSVKRRLPLIFLCVSAFAWCVVKGDDAASGEIAHLLDFIGRSGCDFIRNERVFSAQEAQEHMAYKYRRGSRWLVNGEDFIGHVATGSSITGQPYRVICQGRKRSSAHWLNEELNAYRNRQRSEH